MKVMWIDAVSGISGNMIVGALIDAGCPLEYISDELKKIPVTGYSLSAERVMKNGISAVYFNVTAKTSERFRTFSDIKKLFESSDLASSLIEEILLIFSLLAEAEAKVHGMDAANVHFHEVGALDSIVDIAAFTIAKDYCKIKKIFSSPFHLGSGTTESMHGTIPVPAPATLQLTAGKPVKQSDYGVELTTPTGAAIMASLSESFGLMPPMVLLSTGYGAGTRDLPIPNVTRIAIGELTEQADDIVVIETTIDDMNPEILPHLVERVLHAGAFDAFWQAVSMKKGRTGMLFTIHCPPLIRDTMASLLFSESSTAGVRYYSALRITRERRVESVETSYGVINVKILTGHDAEITVSPEFEECRAAAIKADVSFQQVYDAARDSWREKNR